MGPGLGSALGKDPPRLHITFSLSLNGWLSLLSFALPCLGMHIMTAADSCLVPTICDCWCPLQWALTVANVDESPKSKLLFLRLYHQSERLPAIPGA